MSHIARARAILESGGVRGLASATRSFVAHHPTLVRTLAACRLAYYRRVRGYEAVADPFRLLHVDPNAITVANDDINKYLDAGAIRSGDWDQRTDPYEQSIKYRSVKQRFVEGRRWENTDIHPVLCSRIEQYGEADGCYSVEDLKLRYERIDRLYESMKTDGYDSSKVSKDPNSRIATSLDHICVSIGRRGDFIFCGGGNHRFSIAKILDLESIPVRVVVRHTEWQEYREQIAAGEITLEEPIQADLVDLI